MSLKSQNKTISKLRVAILLDNDFLIDNRVRRTAEVLVKQGYEVHLFATRTSGPETPLHEVQQGIQIHRILQPKDFHYHLKRRWFRSLRTFLSVLRLSPKFDIIHANDVYTLPLGYCLARVHRAKLVYDSHEYWAAALAHSRQKYLQLASTSPQSSRYSVAARYCQALIRLEQWLMPRCDAVVTVSEGIAQLLKTPCSVVVIRNMAPYFESASTYARQKRFHQLWNLPSDTRILLYQGAIKPGRGLEKTIQAVNRLSSMVFVLMGPVYNAEYLQALLEQGNPGVVRVKESVPAHEIEEWTASADVGIVASPRTHDNHVFSLPNKFFSYIQAEVPVLTNDLPEMGRLLMDYPVGQMTNITDDVEIAAKLMHMLTPAVWFAMKEQMAHAKADLCWEQEQIRLIRLYHGLLPIPSSLRLIPSGLLVTELGLRT